VPLDHLSRPTAVAFALAGAAVFVVSLAAGAWLLLVRLRPLPGHVAMGGAVAAWNLLLFTLFALHHSVMARTGAKRWLTRHVPARLERSVFVWIASLLFLVVCGLWRPTREVLWDVGGPAAWLVSGVAVLGAVMTAAAVRLVDIWELAGVRQLLHVRRPPALDPFSTSGLYGLVRHPIYLGWVLLVWAAPVMSSGRLLFAAVSTLYLIVAIPLEERSLESAHGPAYARYCARVRWRMIPGIY
jgi:protein-S-isoprenylcysteine O-methyltransferase Ste14